MPTDQTDPSAARRRPRLPWPAAAGLPDPADRAAWAARQSRLAADTHGERLEPLEVLFLERFEALGHQAEWIPRPPFVPGVGRPASSDFLWVDMDGLRIELKSPARPLYRVVKDKIHKDVAAARRWGLSAENYIIDLGYRPLTAKLAAQLADYNANTATTAITRLWVMSRNGADLTRIHLKKAK